MSSKKNVEEIPAIEGQKSTKRLVKVVVRKGLRTKIDRRRGRYKVKSKKEKEAQKKKKEEDEKKKLLNSPEYKLLLKKLQELQKQKTIEQRTERKIQPSGGYRATSKPYYSSFPKDGRTFTQDDTKLKKIEDELLKTQKLLNDLTNKFKKDDKPSPQQPLTKEQERTQKELKKQAKKEEEERKKAEKEAKKQQEKEEEERKKQQEKERKQKEKEAKKSSGFKLFGRKKDVVSSEEEQDSLKTFFTKRTPQPKFEDQFIEVYGNVSDRLPHHQAQLQQRTTDRQEFKDVKIRAEPLPPTIPVDSPAFKALQPPKVGSIEFENLPLEEQDRLDPETAELELPAMPDETDEEDDFTPSIGNLDTISQPTPEPEPTIITPPTEEQERLRKEIEQKQKDIDELKLSKSVSASKPLKLTDTPLEAIPPISKKGFSISPSDVLGISPPDLSLRINTSRQPQLQAQQNLLITNRQEPLLITDIEEPVSTKELRKELKLSAPIRLAQQEVEKTKSELQEQKAQSIADITELKERLIEEQKTADEKRFKEISEELRRLEEKRFKEIQKELREFEQKEATKIQSAVRGRQARTSYRTQQEKATEIQSAVRGQQAKKVFERKKKSKENRELASKLVKGVVSNVFEKKRKEIEQQEKQQDEASTKIQSAVRGRQARTSYRTQQELERKKEQEIQQEKETKRQELQQQIIELERKKEELRNNLLKYEILKDGQRLKPSQADRLKGDIKLSGVKGLLRSQNIIIQGDIYILLDELKDTMLKISELNKELRKI